MHTRTSRTLLNAVIAFAIGVVALNAWMYFAQPAMVFYPARGLDATPSDWGLIYEDVNLVTPDGVRLYGWYAPRTGSKRVVLLLHGNAGNISHRGDSIAIFHRLGLNVLIVDYRGYGQSSGTPTEQGLYTDAMTAWRYLTDTRGFDPGHIVVFGRSLGGAVAAELATRVRPAALIVESTFDSARSMANAAFPLLSRLIVLRYRFDTRSRVRRVRCPVLVVHSQDDEIIPHYMGQRIFQAANRPKEMLTLHGDHNTGFVQSRPEYERGLGGFLERSVKKGQAAETPR